MYEIYIASLPAFIAIRVNPVSVKEESIKEELYKQMTGISLRAKFLNEVSKISLSQFKLARLYFFFFFTKMSEPVIR